MKKILAILLLAALSLVSQTVTITKTPYEQFNCSMDFVQVIGTDGTTLVSVTTTNVRTGVDTTATMIAASPAPAVQPGTDKVIYRVQNGQPGETHRISIKVTDSISGERYEGIMQVTINAASNQ